MWWGAWISFESPKEWFSIKINILDNENIEYNWLDEKWPILERFSIIWYNDGMSDIRWDLLKPNLTVDWLKEFIPSIIEEVKLELETTNPSIKEIVIYWNVELDDMFFAGYTRWDASSIKNIETSISSDKYEWWIEIETTTWEIVNYSWDKFDKIVETINIVYNPNNIEEFKYCYDDIFNMPTFELNEDWEDEECVSKEDLYEQHYNDVRNNWWA